MTGQFCREAKNTPETQRRVHILESERFNPESQKRVKNPGSLRRVYTTESLRRVPLMN